MFNLFLDSVILGFIGGIIPGPILSAIFTKILQAGFKKSFQLIFYALVVESAFALANLLAFAYLPVGECFFYYLSLVGACILLWIAKSLWSINKIDGENQLSFGFSKVVVLTMTNGMFWIFETTVSVPKALALDRMMPMGKFAFLGLFEIGWLVATIGIAYIFSRFRPLLVKPKVIGFVFKAFSITFIYFSLDMLFKSIKFLYF